MTRLARSREEIRKNLNIPKGHRLVLNGLVQIGDMLWDEVAFKWVPVSEEDVAYNVTDLYGVVRPR